MNTVATNCGGCGVVCPEAPECNVAVCAEGICGTEAVADGTECAIGTCVGGVCTEPAPIEEPPPVA